jgi:ribonuclease Z
MTPELLPAEPTAIIDAMLVTDRRVLLVGPPGIGKSTLVNALAGALYQAGRDCCCLNADPGTPLFGPPGVVSLGKWHGEGWVLEGIEALCTLDAGRFRLPLVSALARLTRKLPPGVVLVDGPGVVRGIAGAELLPAITQAAQIDLVLTLVREGHSLPLAQELAALPVEAAVVQAKAEAQRPGKRSRGRERTALWDAYLMNAEERRLALDGLRVIGTPPPLAVPAPWLGRQVALLAGGRTVAMGEVTAVTEGALRLRLPPGTPMADTLLVRDAQRALDGRLATSERFTADRLEYQPPPDMAPQPPSGTTGGPRVVGRVGGLSVSLVNGVFGDPLLHARLRYVRRSLLFDLGEGSRLSARIAHQVSDVFITHTHMDHIAGFLWLLRSRIGELPVCRLYGPPGLAQNIEGLTRGILWDRIEERAPRFVVTELHGERLRRFAVQAGQSGCQPLGEELAVEGILLAEPGFRVRATTLQHGVSPVLAYAFEPAPQINVRKERLQAEGLAPGPWLGELKRHIQAGENDASIRLPDGRTGTTATLADLVLISPGKKLVYATDFSDGEANRRRLIELAHGAHTLFCEATFREADAAQAAHTAHLTTRACGEIAQQAGVARLVPFHFSRRYEDDPQPLYEEIAEYCARVAVPKSMSVFEVTI